MSNNLGIILDPNSLKNIEYIVKKADEYNFHSAWTTELYRSSFEQLTYIAGLTKEIKIGSAVTLAFVRSPLMTIISAMDIDQISNGRLILGLGSGAINTNRKWHCNNHFANPSERMSSLLKILKIIQNGLYKGQDIEYEDNFYNIEIKAFKRPFKPLRSEIPTIVAGIGPKMSRVALEESDGYLGHVVCSLDYLKNNILPIRSDKHTSISSIILCAINKDKFQAINDCKGTIAFYSIVKAYAKPFIQLGFEENIKKIREAYFKQDVQGMLDNVSNEMVEKFAVVGSAEEVSEKIEVYKKILDLPILTAPHYYISHEKLEYYQNEILETFKVF